MLRAHPSICSHFSSQDQIKKYSKQNGFVSEMENMRKAFLMRPGCPQFSTRTTSVSHVGKTSPAPYRQERLEKLAACKELLAVVLRYPMRAQTF